MDFMPSPSLTKSSSAWKTYFYWLFWISVVFFTVYPISNWLTAQRETVFSLYVQAELQIPFVPQFVWIYLSLYLLFIIPPFFLSASRMHALGKRLVGATLFCGLMFLLLPAELGFERTTPDDPFYRSIFARLFAVDLPHNMAPSLHVTFSAMILFVLLNESQSTLARAVFGTWLVLICASTVLVHQHHLLDVVTGLLVATAFYPVEDKGDHHD
jgi:membrane-associated phospholipid phosphatase